MQPFAKKLLSGKDNLKSWLFAAALFIIALLLINNILAGIFSKQDDNKAADGWLGYIREQTLSVLWAEIPVLTSGSANQDKNQLLVFKCLSDFVAAGYSSTEQLLKKTDPLIFAQYDQQQSISAAANVQNSAAEKDTKVDSGNKPPESNPKLDAANPVAAIYCTHSGESYILSSGSDRAEKGQAGDIMTVAGHLRDSLQDKGISAIFIDKVHDTSYDNSYGESQETVQQLVAEYPSLKIILDLHRDALGDDVREITEIDGKTAAQVLFVVGTDDRQEHPDWEKNLALSEKLSNKLNQLYPGISKGIITRAGAFNQQYHTGAMLIEMGSVGNSLEDVLNAADLLAETLTIILADM